MTALLAAEIISPEYSTYDVSLIERYGSFGLIAILILGLGYFLYRYVPIWMESVNSTIIAIKVTFEETLQVIRDDCLAAAVREEARQKEERTMFLALLSEQRLFAQQEMAAYRETVRTNVAHLAEKIDALEKKRD